MPYTLLRVTDAGVVLWDYHVIRLEMNGENVAREPLLAFGRGAAPGVWAVWTEPTLGVRAQMRPASRLCDGVPARFVTSPVAGRVGGFSKPGSPGPYDQIRLEGTATLLTSPDGTEIYEACCAAVVGWDGQRIVCVPFDRPRVWSTAEAAIRDHLPVREGAILAISDAILLVNAVKGTCALAEPHGGRFPSEVRGEIEVLFERLTRRPGMR